MITAKGNSEICRMYQLFMTGVFFNIIQVDFLLSFLLSVMHELNSALNIVHFLCWTFFKCTFTMPTWKLYQSADGSFGMRKSLWDVERKLKEISLKLGQVFECEYIPNNLSISDLKIINVKSYFWGNKDCFTGICNWFPNISGYNWWYIHTKIALYPIK